MPGFHHTTLPELLATNNIEIAQQLFRISSMRLTHRVLRERAQGQKNNLSMGSVTLLATQLNITMATKT